jgi:hypothetical protein
MVLRTVALLGGISWVGGESWSRFLACLAGFVIARLAVTALFGPQPRQRQHSVVESADHAS